MGDQDTVGLAAIEKRVHSQNGEDGIIAFLIDALHGCERRYLEIGCGTGKRNNCTLLAKQGWFGLAIDRKVKRLQAFRDFCAIEGLHNVQTLAMPAERKSAVEFARLMPDPDVFSIDIDSIDWHVAKAMTDAGFRPKIAVCEYNAAFGVRPITVAYRYPFERARGLKHFYFGASVAAWRRLWGPLGYRFVTVDSSGINSFFVKRDAADMARVDCVDWLAWADSAGLKVATGNTARARWRAVKDMAFETV